jgi:hypothetical protein
LVIFINCSLKTSSKIENFFNNGITIPNTIEIFDNETFHDVYTSSTVRGKRGSFLKQMSLLPAEKDVDRAPSAFKQFRNYGKDASASDTIFKARSLFSALINTFR